MVAEAHTVDHGRVHRSNEHAFTFRGDDQIGYGDRVGGGNRPIPLGGGSDEARRKHLAGGERLIDLEATEAPVQCRLGGGQGLFPAPASRRVAELGDAAGHHHGCGQHECASQHGHDGECSTAVFAVAGTDERAKAEVDHVFLIWISVLTVLTVPVGASTIATSVSRMRVIDATSGESNEKLLPGTTSPAITSTLSPASVDLTSDPSDPIVQVTVSPVSMVRSASSSSHTAT